MHVDPRPRHILSYMPWVTAIQAQLPGSSPCGGCKSKRLPFACMLSMALLKPYEVFLGPCWPLGLSLAFHPRSPLHVGA